MHDSLGVRFLPAPLRPRQHGLLVGALRLVLGHPVQEAHDLGHKFVHVLRGHLLQRLHLQGSAKGGAGLLRHLFKVTIGALPDLSGADVWAADLWVQLM